MKQNLILKYGLGEAAITIAYIVLVVVLMNNGKALFGDGREVISGVAMLLLLVFSVAVMGVTIFGRSILWYLDGHKKEALLLVAYKLGFLFVVLFLIFAGLVLRNI